MTALLPDVVRDAIQSQSVYSASESFGVVTLALLIILLLELEALRVTHHSRERTPALQAVTGPVLLAVVLSIVVRVIELLS